MTPPSEGRACGYFDNGFDTKHEHRTNCRACLLERISVLTEAYAAAEARAVVWATDDAPFTGPQVKVLLDENEQLRTRVEAAERERDDLAARLGGEPNWDHIYCPACGSCGIMDCCPAPKCIHRESNQKQYDDLSKDADDLYERAEALQAQLTEAERAQRALRAKLEQLIVDWIQADRLERDDYYGTDAYGRCVDAIKMALTGAPSEGGK